MQDYAGQTLTVGDTVIAAEAHGRNSGASLVKGVITGFTKEFVYIDASTYFTSDTMVRRIRPKKVYKIDPRT